MLLVAVLALSCSVCAQTQVPSSDPQAISLAAKSMSAMTGGASIADIMLNGTTASLMNSVPDSGTVTMVAKGPNQSRVDFSLSAGKRNEIRSLVNGIPQGAWTNADGQSHRYAGHNCWTDAVWFFPVLSTLARADSNVVLTYVGLENHEGVSVQHLRLYRYIPAKSPQITAVVQQLSTVDFYLDATSLLPLAIAFQTHPDDDQNPNLPVEVRFANYRNVNNVLAPLHIQKLLDGSPILDIVITTAEFNTDIPDSLFGLQ
jgi:hypothetical protein